MVNAPTQSARMGASGETSRWHTYGGSHGDLGIVLWFARDAPTPASTPRKLDRRGTHGFWVGFAFT
jgi:hypothetical protein